MAVYLDGLDVLQIRCRKLDAVRQSVNSLYLAGSIDIDGVHTVCIRRQCSTVQGNRSRVVADVGNLEVISCIMIALYRAGQCSTVGIGEYHGALGGVLSSKAELVVNRYLEGAVVLPLVIRPKRTTNVDIFLNLMRVCGQRDRFFKIGSFLEANLSVTDFKAFQGLIKQRIQFTTKHVIDGFRGGLAVFQLQRILLGGQSIEEGSRFYGLLIGSLAGSSFAGSSFAGSSFAGSSLGRSSLAGSSLAGSGLAGSSFAGSSLAGSGLRRSGLRRSSLAGSSLAGSSLAGSSFAGCSFAGSGLNKGIRRSLLRHGLAFRFSFCLHSGACGI